MTYNSGAYGSGSQTTATKTDGVSLTLKGATFTRTGYTQTGWSEDYYGSTKIYSLSSSYTLNSGTTLYPYWTANTYSISYSLNSGAHGSKHPTSAMYDSAFYVSAPSRSGYTFAGWTVTSGLNTSTAKWGTSSSPSTSISSSSTKCVNGTGSVYFKNLTTTSGGSVTLTANWTEVQKPTYTVTYSAGYYGSGSQTTATKTKDVSLTLKDATFTRTGYTQTGWSTDYYGSTKDYYLSGSYTSNSGTTLYPYWTANAYSISYVLNSGSHGSTHPTSATYDSAFYVSAPTRSGYTFAGWTVTSGLNTSTAKWGTSSSPSTSISSSSTKCVNGTSSVYFKNLTATLGGSVTLTANWTEVQKPTYTVTYSAGYYGSGSRSPSTKTHGETLTLSGAAFTRTGYTQTGWSEDYYGSTKDYSLSGSYTSNSGTTLYPYWTANTYSISYSLNSGSHGSTHPTSATYDSAFSVSAPSRSGYTFAGWTVTSGLNTSTAKWGTSSSPSTSISSSSTKCVNGTGSVYFKNLTATSGGSVTLTANWTTIPTYTVVYKPGTYGAEAQTSDVKVQNQALMLKGALFTHVGFVQTGWSSDPDGKTKDYELSGQYTANSGITLYPYWTVIGPDNDYFVNAREIVGDSGTDVGNTTEATAESEDIAAQHFDHSIWWKWKAPGKGVVSFVASKSKGEYWKHYFTIGVCIETQSKGRSVLAGPSSTYDEEKLTFACEKGVTYYVMVASDPSSGGGEHNVVLNWSFTPGAYKIVDGKTLVYHDTTITQADVTTNLPIVVSGCHVTMENVKIESSGTIVEVGDNGGALTFSGVDLRSVVTPVSIVGSSNAVEMLSGRVESTGDAAIRSRSRFAMLSVSGGVVSGYGVGVGLNGNGDLLCMNGGRVEVDHGVAIQMNGNGPAFVMQGGEVRIVSESGTCGVAMYGNGSRFVMSGGVIGVPASAVAFVGHMSCCELYGGTICGGGGVLCHGTTSIIVPASSKIGVEAIGNPDDMISFEGKNYQAGDAVMLIDLTTSSWDVSTGYGTYRSSVWKIDGGLFISRHGKPISIYGDNSAASGFVAGGHYSAPAALFDEGVRAPRTVLVPCLEHANCQILKRGCAILPGEKAEYDTELKGYAPSGLPMGLKYDKTTGMITGAATKPGEYVVKLTKSGMESETLTIVVTAVPKLSVTFVGSGTGKVSGAGEHLANAKVTLKATADTKDAAATVKSAFAGWFADADCTQPLDGTVDYRTASFPYVMPAEDVAIYAKFVTVAEDAARLSVANIAAGETLVVSDSWTKKIEVDSYSIPSVSAKGLPAGLKFDAKTLTISGKPTKPGKYDIELSLKNASVKTAKKFTFKIVVPNLESDLIADGIDYASDAYVYVAGTKIAPILPVLAEGVTVKAAGLPSGLKLVGGKNRVPYSIEGASTAKPGAYTVTLTLTKGKVKETATITVNIENRKLDLVMATCDGSLTNGCKVTGGGSYAAGKKVTLRATAATYKKATAKKPEQKATVFAGWYRNPDCTEVLVGTVDYRTTSYSYVTTDQDETIYAKFVPAADDGTISLSVNGNEVVDDSGVVRVVVKDAATLPTVVIGSVSIPKASVKGLPAGLKWNAKKNCFTGAPTKPGVYKVAFSLKNTTVKKAIVRAFMIEVPNFESPAFPGLKSASDAYPVSVGVAALPAVDAGLASTYAGYTVKVTGLPSGLAWKSGVLTGLAKKAGDYTVTFTATKGKDKQVSTITIHVEALPDWAVGTFVGMVRQVDRDESGEIIEDEDGLHDWYDILTTVSVTSAGKVSGKLHFESGTDVSFKSDSISERTDAGYIVRGQLKARGIASDFELLLRKIGIEATGVGDLGAVDVLMRQTSRQEGSSWIECGETTFSTDEDAPLRQNVWSSKKLPLPPSVNGVKKVVEHKDDVYTLTFGKNGSVKVSLAKADKPTKAIASGSATLSIVEYVSGEWNCELCTSVVVKKNDYGAVRIFDVTISADRTVICLPQK